MIQAGLRLRIKKCGGMSRKAAEYQPVRGTFTAAGEINVPFEEATTTRSNSAVQQREIYVATTATMPEEASPAVRCETIFCLFPRAAGLFAVMR